MLLLRRPAAVISDRSHIRTLLISVVRYSKKDDSSSSDSDNEKAKKSAKQSKQETTDRLNSLLKLMIEEESNVSEKVKQLELPKPRPSLMRKKEMKKKEKTFEESLSDAAKDVASSLGDTTGQTESELLNKLLGRSPPPAAGPEGTTDTPQKSSSDLSEVLTGMKVEQTVPQPQLSRAEQVRQVLQKSQPRLLPQSVDKSVSGRLKRRSQQQSKRTGAQVDLFGAQPFTYFKDIKPAEQPCKLETWNNCMQRELRLAVTHPPRNIYEQMILWTEKGMFWQFPIDNEQGLEEEKKVYFAEHIFLEQHVEGWCPDKGPVRHFMELVCVGLSKNHWLTVEEKKQHIAWYKDFFTDKKMLLKEIGAGNIGDGSAESQPSETKV